jgi:glucose-6-phosphate isomerase
VAGMMGVKNFNEFLAGGLEIDEHINKAEDKDNLPLNLALIAFWYRNICRKDTQTIIPYSHRLRSFVPFCKQLEMESNGKTITNNKEKTKIDTGYVVWGGEGTNGQHSYHQLLHQGSDWHPIDFVLPLKDSPILSKNGLNRNHKNHMVSSCLSQIEVLSNGYNKGNVFQNLEGNRPSNLLTLEDISPKSIGNLIAIYEYKTIYLSIFWDINPFDQWGVEHSKVTEDSISSRENISKFNKTILDLYDL